MKILHLMPYCPVPPVFGGALRIYHLLKSLVKHHDVTVATYGTLRDRQLLEEAFGKAIRSIQMIPGGWTTRYRRVGQVYALCTNHSFFHLLAHRKEMQNLIDSITEKESFDLVQTEFPMMGAFNVQSDAVKVLDAHNVEYDNFRRMWVTTRSLVRKLHYYREYRKLYHEEIDACNKQDALFVTSSRDRSLFELDVPTVPKYIIPNGVDTTYFKPSEQSPEPHTLVFTGMMAYVPNYDGMLYFLDTVFPRIRKQIPDAKIYVVGNRPPKELQQRASDSVIITGYVDDVRQYIARASVYVVPLRMGSGTRLKVLEAMAMKKPIVTTSIGCEGIQVQQGETAFVEDDPVRFAERVVQLIRDPVLQETLVRRGHELVNEHYEWSVINEVVERAYQELLEAKRYPDKNRVALGETFTVPRKESTKDFLPLETGMS